MWKEVPSFEKYEASDGGFVRNKRTGNILTPSVHRDGTGVPNVTLVGYNGNKTFEIRFIIACTFLNVDINAKPKPKFEYIDGNKFNNAISNIRIKDNTAIEGELWKPIVEWEGLYEVSNLGRVKRLGRTETYIRKDTGEQVERHYSDLIMKPTKTNKGEYLSINLISGNRSSYPFIHRLVATAFIPNPDNFPEVNHKDGNKHNNRSDNLEWCTRLENVAHSIETGLRSPYKGQDRSVKAIKCIETGVVYPNAKQAAQSIGISYDYFMERLHDNKPCHELHFIQVKEDRRVKCLDTGEIFESLAEAQDKFGFTIGDSIKRRTCIHGWTFRYMKDDIKDEEAYLWECRNRYSKWPRAEKRWEDK